MFDLHSDMSKLLFLCPLCGGCTFAQHSMLEYARDWNKCPSCGYMEEKTVSRNRVINVLAPDKLVEPFVDPISAQLVKKVRGMAIGKTYGHDDEKTNDNVKCPNCKSDNSKTP